MKFAAALLATVSANRYESMNEDELLVNLESTLSSALSSEARGDADAAVAKTAAIKNIQKALTARILKRLDDGQPLVEVARKMKAIEGMQPQINDMERRLGIMQSVEPVLENAIKTLQKVVDVRGMGKKWVRSPAGPRLRPTIDTRTGWLEIGLRKQCAWCPCFNALSNLFKH